MKTSVSLLACFFLFISVSRAQEPGYSFKEKYSVSVPAGLAISSSDGNIDVVASDGKEIEVFYIVKKNNRLLDMTRKELEAEVILEVIPSKNGLQISVKHKEYFSLNWLDRISVDFRVTVPRQTSCDLKTSDGNISLDGLSADQDFHTSDGNIHADNIIGSLTGKTSDGNIELTGIKGAVDAGTSDENIDLDNIAGDVRLSTSDGNIRLARVKGSTYAKTSDGDISFKEISGSLKAYTSDGNLRGSVVELQKELTLKTSGGNIDVTIPDRLGLDLDIRGESLSVPLSNFSGKSEEKFIQGKTNGGGILVNLSTSDGRVKIVYL